MEFNCSRAPCGSQGTNRSVPLFCAFENLARNVPARLMCFSAAWQELTCPFERKFHIGSHSRSKTVRKHDNPFCVRPLNYIGQIENEKKEKRNPPGVTRFILPLNWSMAISRSCPWRPPCMIGTSAPLQIFQIGVSRGRRPASSGKNKVPAISVPLMEQLLLVASTAFPWIVWADRGGCVLH